MSKKISGGVFEIRKGVFAYGAPGERAAAVVARGADGQWAGVRGVKPIIGLGSKVGAPAAAVDKLADLRA